MSEETMPEIDPVTKAFNIYANKCFELGNAIYKMDKQEKDFDTFRHNLLVDIDKLAKEHDKIVAQKNAKKAEVELPKEEVPVVQS